MATWYLLTNFKTPAGLRIAGELIDDAQENITQLQMSGAFLVPSSLPYIAAVAPYAVQLREQGADPLEIQSLMLAAYQAMQEGETLEPVLNATELAAIPVASRSSGSLCVKLDDRTLWQFDTSADAASTWCIVPAVGSGRWKRWDQLVGAVHAPVADAAAVQGIAATDRKDGMVVAKLDDYTWWKFEAASAAGASAWVIVPLAGTGRWSRREPSLADLGAVSGASLIGSNAAGYATPNVLTQLAEVMALVVAGMQVQKKSLPVVFGDLSVAGHSKQLNLGTALPANARIVGYESKLTTPFTGGGMSSLVVKVGSAADDDAIIVATDWFAPAVDGQAATTAVGIAPNKHFVAGTQLLLTATGDQNLNGLTAGAGQLDVLYVVLP